MRRRLSGPATSSVVALVLLVTGSSGVTQGVPATRPLAIEDAVSARSFQTQGGPAAISRDGRLVAYPTCDPRRIAVRPGEGFQAVATPNAAYRSMGCDIWISDVVSGQAQNLTPNAGNNWGPSWSPDGQSLAFYSDRSGAARVWLWDRASGESRMIADLTTRTFFGFEVPLWTPDGRQLVVKFFPQGKTQGELDGHGERATRASDAAPGSTLVLFQSGRASSAAADAAAGRTRLSDFSLTDIGLIDVSSGRARRVASHVRIGAGTQRLSPDGAELAFLDSAGLGQRGIATYSLAIVTLATGRRRDVVSGIQQDFAGPLSWSPDGRWLAYTSASAAPTPRERPTDDAPGRDAANLFVVSRDGGAPRRFDGAPEGTFSTDFLPPLWDGQSRTVYAIGAKRLWRGDLASGRVSLVPVSLDADVEIRRLLAADARRVWTTDGDAAVHVLTRNSRTRRQGFARIDLASGRVTALLEEDMSIDELFDQPVVSPEGTHVIYPAESASESADLWIADRGFASVKRLTTLNPQLGSYAFGRSRLMEFLDADGRPLRATLLLPAGFDERKRYPMVVWVYAGEMGSRQPNQFGLIGLSAYNMHMLTTRGYAVLWPDIPVRPGTAMQGLMKTVMPAIDRAVSMGVADPARLAVMGQSNGGYSVLALIVQTHRFKAAVMNAGFGNLSAMYGRMGDDGTAMSVPFLEHHSSGMGAPPWEAPLRYLENSPVFYLDRVDTPLIIQAGSSDRSIIGGSDEVFVGLKRLGKDVTYLRYGGEGHVLSALPNLTDYWQRVLAFLKRCLKVDAESSR